MYSVAERKSFTNVAYWLKSLEDNCSLGISSVLVGNKCDLAERREVSCEEGRTMAKRNGMLFFETSAKTGEGIESVFTAVTKRIIDNNPKITAHVDRQKLSGSAKGKEDSICC